MSLKPTLYNNKVSNTQLCVLAHSAPHLKNGLQLFQHSDARMRQHLHAGCLTQTASFRNEPEMFDDVSEVFFNYTFRHHSTSSYQIYVSLWIQLCVQRFQFTFNSQMDLIICWREKMQISQIHISSVLSMYQLHEITTTTLLNMGTCPCQHQVANELSPSTFQTISTNLWAILMSEKGVCKDT